MQEDKHTQLNINFELSNNIHSANRMLIAAGFNEKSEAIKQILPLLAYKYLSEKFDNSSEDIGYQLNEEYKYNNLLINKGNVIGTLKKGIEQITQENDNPQAADVFYDLFDIMDFRKFNNNESWLVFIDVVEKICSETTATIGEMVIFLAKFVSDDEIAFTTGPTEDIIKLIAANQQDVKNIYDPFADGGILLAEIGNIITVENYYGQHPNKEKCVLAKMVLLTNNVNYKNIFIRCNDIFEPEVWDVKFDLCVSIPPFGRRDKLFYNEDYRFQPYAPKRALELAYLLEMLYNLDKNGTIKIIVPDSVIRTGPDRKIIQYLIDKELISTIIALPGGLFLETPVQTDLIVINQKPKDGVYYLNLRTVPFERTSKRHIIIQNIDKYISILDNREEIELLSRIATINDIAKNDYNLAINRYVDQEKLEEIDMKQTIANIKAIKKELKQVDEELNQKIGDLL